MTIELTDPDQAAPILSPDALAFVAQLERRFGTRRLQLLDDRADRQTRIDNGERPGFLAETTALRDGDWQVARPPLDLTKRHVEITGPVDAKLVINALNSGADVFMADFEDSAAPTWATMVSGQQNLYDAVRHDLTHTSADGRSYRVSDDPATLVVRPRGLHLEERHLLVDGRPVSACLFDFGLYFFWNARELLASGTGPYFYLPKLESHREARWWNDVFTHAQASLGIAHGSIRATVLIETILAAFEMDEILFELRDHSAGLNAGRWDYIFSIIKTFRADPDLVLPDRHQIAMTVPFMTAYTDLLIRTCHRRGAHAMGGMAAFIPNRRDSEVTDRAIRKVMADKTREVEAGHDGTWVAHPDLVEVAAGVFAEALGGRPNQMERQRPDVDPNALELLDFRVPAGAVTEQGVRTNVDVALQYLAAWLCGNGAVAIYDLMEDAATAEISRSQVWQWIQRGVVTVDDVKVDEALYRRIVDEELSRIAAEIGESAFISGRFPEARRLLDELVLAPTCADFLTLLASQSID
jgi:malate synthase